MFGASVSELYLLIKSLINIIWEGSRSMCDHKKYIYSVHRNCESGLAMIIQACCTQAGPARAAGRRGGIDR